MGRAGYQRPPLECVCKAQHVLSPAAMAIVISASTRGLLHTVGKGGIVQPLCILTAFDHPEVVSKYDGRVVTFVTQ